MQCPICQQALDGGELVMVCAPCHKQLGGGLSVGSTGEFIALGAHVAGEAAALSDESPQAGSACAWCGKREDAVKKLLGRRGTALCDECVALAADIMDAELGPGWR